MKRLLAIIFALFFVSGMFIPAFAQKAHHKKAAVAKEMIRGTVVSVDAAKKEIVVKDEKTGKDKTFVVSEKAVSVVKAGDMVKVKVKPGKNIAEAVNVIAQEAQKQ